MNGVELMASWLTPAVLFCVMNVMIGTIFFRSSLKPPRAKDELAAVAPRLERVSSFLERVKSFNLSRYESERQPDPVHEAAREEEEEYHRVWRTRSVPVAEAARELEEDSYHEIIEEPHRAWRTSPVPAAREEEEAFHEATEEPHRVGRTRSVPVAEAARDEEDEAFHEIEEPDHHVARTRSVPVTAAAAPAREVAEIHQQIEEPQPAARAASPPAAKALKKSASEKMLTVKEKEEEDEEYERRPATARRRAEGEEVDGKANDFINKFRQQLKLQRMDSIVRYNEMIDRGAGRYR